MEEHCSTPPVTLMALGDTLIATAFAQMLTNTKNRTGANLK
jgi:diphthamide biosynthesis methyltransferase